MSHICSPLRYPGGKSRIFPFVSQLFYENDLIGSSYAEPYAGGAGLALRLLFGEYVDHVYINDLDPAIYAFWLAELTRGEELCDWVESVDVSMENWRYYKRIHSDARSADLFELAKATFFLNRTNISGVLTGGVIGGQSQNGKYKMDARFNKPDLIARIKRIGMFRHRITVSNEDGLRFVRKLDAKPESIFIYLDPPYVQKGADLYMNFLRDADHRLLAKDVHKIRKPWMISYDYNDVILDLYSTNKKVRYRISQSTSNRVGNEVLIFSEKLIFEESINKLNSVFYL